MNASITGMIDLLFKDTAMNNETRALYEELLNNCQEHYDDLISRGLSETEALDAVVESLQGMKEVIDEYPKKTTASAPEEPKAGTGSGEESEPKHDEPVQGDQVFAADNLRSIVAELRNCDVTLNRSGDGKIHVRSENPELYRCEFNGSCLRIVQNNQTGPMNGEHMEPEEISVRGILSFVGKVLSTTASYINEQTSIYIDVPETVLDEIRMSSMSGDIDSCHLTARKIQLATTSGDIHFNIPKSAKAVRFTARSTSGDISLEGNAEETEINSISGDIHMRGDCRNAVLKSTSGEADFDGCAAALTAHTVSGSLSLTVLNTDIRNIEAASTSGSVTVRLPEGITGVHQVMRSVSGSIRSRYTDSGSSADLQIRASTVSGSISIW